MKSLSRLCVVSAAVAVTLMQTASAISPAHYASYPIRMCRGLVLPVEAPSPSAGNTAQGEGVVTAIDPPRRLVIDGPIDRVMDSMVMKYKVKPTISIDGIKVGDKVGFTVDRMYTILEIHVVGKAH